MKKKEVKIEDIVKEIMTQAKSAYAECQKTGDWIRFGTILKGIYKSYYRTNPLYTQAMLTILQSTPKDNVETEIITGNYGFRVHAAKASKIVIDDVKAISEALGDKVAKRYLEGINPCDKYMISQSAKYSKDLEKFMKGVITVAGSTGFNK